jgi:hypothetical protein
MSVHSTVGEGTEITICLPALNGEAQTEDDSSVTLA